VKPIALLALLVALAFAQHWDIERVDSAGWGRDVRMRWHPDGRLFLCYQDTSGRIRLASRDSVWSYDSVTGTSGYYGVDFSISTQGQVGVTWLNPDYPWQVLLASNQGDSWEYDSTGLVVTGPGPALIAYDSAGVATVVYTCTDSNSGCTIVRARHVDSLWNTDTILGGGGWSATLFCHEYLISTRDSASLLYVFADGFPGPGLARPWFYQDLYVARESLDTWVPTRKAHAWYGWLQAAAMALDSLGAAQACWCVDNAPAFRYEDDTLDAQAYASSVAIDRMNRPCIAYTRPELMFTCRLDSQWRSSAVSYATNSASSISAVLGEDGEPLIAFSTVDGLWLAQGVDIMAQSEEQREPSTHDSRLTATVVRNVLDLPVASRAISSALFDMTGRWVKELHQGANDVSGLSPGVYLVREEQQALSPKPQAVRKVIIAR
jgi:hypothetical protein